MTENSLLDDKSEKEATKENDIDYLKIESNRRCAKLEHLKGVILSSILIFICSSAYIYSSCTIQEYAFKKVSTIIAIILLIISESVLLDISTSNPGYQTENKMSVKEYIQTTPTVKIGKSVYILKYCNTCHLVRDVRTFHCASCNRCVLDHDHHCIYISNCVGQKNLKKFLIFVFIIFINCIFLAISSGLCIRCISKVLVYVKKYIDKLVILIVNLLIICFFLIFVSILLSQQVYLISKGITKNESIRNKYDATVFSKGNCIKNWEYFCCKDNNDDYTDKIKLIHGSINI